MRFYKADQNFLKKNFYVNLLINIVYYVYIDLYKHIYIPNQAIRVAKLCFLLFFSLKNTHECGGHMSLALTLSFNFCGSHTYTCLLLACKIVLTLINRNYGKSLLVVGIYLHFYLTSLKVQEIINEIRNPRLPPVHFHEYITETCRYQLAVLLNEINSIVEPLNLLKSVVSNILNVTLLGLIKAHCKIVLVAKIFVLLCNSKLLRLSTLPYLNY